MMMQREVMPFARRIRTKLCACLRMMIIKIKSYTVIRRNRDPGDNLASAVTKAEVKPAIGVGRKLNRTFFIAKQTNRRAGRIAAGTHVNPCLPL